MSDEKKQKRIIAVSRLSTGTYRGVSIFETVTGFAVSLGTMIYEADLLSHIKGYIDNWYG